VYLTLNWDAMPTNLNEEDPERVGATMILDPPDSWPDASTAPDLQNVANWRMNGWVDSLSISRCAGTKKSLFLSRNPVSAS